MQEINFDSQSLIENDIENPSPKKHKHFKRIRDWYTNLSQNQRYVFWISTIIILIIILGTISILVILFRANQQIPKIQSSNTNKIVKKVVAKTPPKYVDPLDGTYVTSKSVLNKPPLAVMVENSTSARPQSGLDSADLVYEAQVEGAITRFMAVYLKNSPTSIGPVRSARLYYISWAQGLGAIYTHWGGNIYALEKLQSQNIPNLNGITTASSNNTCPTSASITYTFCRSLQRYAPHNAYGNALGLWNLAKSDGFFPQLTLGKNETPYKFASTPKTSSLGVNGSSISIFFDQGVVPYDVQWIYSQANNNYIRYNGGTLQYDANTNQSLTAKNVVVLYVNGYTTSYPGEGTTEAAAPIWIMQTVGSGNAYIFNNGHETKATWIKTSNNSRMQFKDLNGNTITFQRGEIWFEILQSQTGSFTYTP